MLARPSQILACLLGLILIVAATLKGEQLANNPIATGPFGMARWLGVGSIVAEMSFGLWLLAGCYPATTRWGAIALFSCFAGVSLWHASAGESSCSCLGEIAVKPWFVFGFDLLAVLALVLLRPVSAPNLPREESDRSRAALVILGSLLVGFPVAILIGLLPAGLPLVSSPPEIDLGTSSIGDATEATFHLTNVTPAPVTIMSTRTSCRCLRVEPENLTVLPGHAATLRALLVPDQGYQGRLRIDVAGYSRAGETLFDLLVHAQVR